MLHCPAGNRSRTEVMKGEKGHWQGLIAQGKRLAACRNEAEGAGEPGRRMQAAFWGI
jgi:hypothetical protein